jgi:hypothetical protein
MSMLTVVYLQSTKNVLAALTRAAPPGPGEQVTALVGTSLPVRAVGKSSTQIAIPISELAVVTVNDIQPNAVLDPHGFQVVDDPQDKTVHHVTPILTSAPSPTTPKITITLTKTTGAVIRAVHVHTTKLTVAAVLQKVTQPPQAATVISPITLGPSSSPVVYPVAPASEFTAGGPWDFAVFIQGMLPQALSKSL